MTETSIAPGGGMQVGPAALAAAQWWAEQVTGSPRRNDGSDGLAAALSLLVADATPVKEDATTKFVNALAPVIQAAIDRGYGSTLSVDYGPDQTLAEAAKVAGISTSRFPWKTTQWARAEYVTVSAGYRSATRLVWASDEWLTNRPPCTSQKWGEIAHHGEPFACSLPLYHDEDHQYDKPISLCSRCGKAENWPSHITEEWRAADHDFQPMPAGQPYEGASA